MPRKDFTDITILLDRSFSMSNIWEGTLGGVNKYMQDMRAVPGDGCWSLYLFDDEFTEVYAGVPEAQAPLLTRETYVPRGNTALVWAGCLAIDAVGRRLAAMPEHKRPGRVAFVVMTDGEENHSQFKAPRFTSGDLAHRIRHQREAYGWQFVFLGANQDSFTVADALNIPTRGTSNYHHSDAGAAVVLHAVSAGTRAWKLDGNDSAAGLIIDPGAAAPEVDVTVAVKK